jgi:hypothetical protein
VNPHVTCTYRCEQLLLVDAHERSRLSARRKRMAKFKGRRPKTRWLGGHPPPRHWIDEAWDAVWDR